MFFLLLPCDHKIMAMQSCLICGSSKVVKGFYINQTIIRSSLPEVFCDKGVLRNFAKFTGKHLCQSLFIYKVAGLFLYTTPLVAISVSSSFLLDFLVGTNSIHLQASLLFFTRLAFVFHHT